MLKSIFSTIRIFVIPRQPALFVLMYPCTLLCIGKWIANHEAANLSLLEVGLLWDLFLGTWFMIDVMCREQVKLSAFIHELADSTYSEVPLREVILDTDQREHVENSSFYQYLKNQSLPWDHYESVKPIHVGLGEFSAFFTPVTYHIPFMRSYLFFLYSPDTTDASERFAILHEVSHTLGMDFALASSFAKHVKLPLFALALSLLMFQWNRMSILLLLLTILSLASMQRVFTNWYKVFRLSSEISADTHALFLMSQTDRLALQQPNAPDPLAQDRVLSDSDHFLRVAAYREHLNSPTPTPAKFRTVFDMSRYLTDLNFSGVIAGCSLLILGAFLKDATPGVIKYALWGVVLLVGLTVFRYGIYFIRGLVVDLVMLGTIKWNEENRGFQFQLQRRS